MTRLNLVPPQELMDQHLFSEWRKIKMVPKSLARSLKARGAQDVFVRIPCEFCLNTGHVSFFYDKGAYLKKRFDALTAELQKRGVYKFNEYAGLDPDGIFTSLPKPFRRDYKPTDVALAIVRERIALRVAQRPSWYRTNGIVV
jgi:deoxyribonuclease (pyrimidine dimer)